MLQCGLHRVGGHAAHRAQRAGEHGVAQRAEQGEVSVALLAGDDAVDDFHAAHRADATGRALAAGLLGAEGHRVACHLRHVHAVVKGDDAAVADHRPHGGVLLVVERDVELRRRQVGAQRSAHLRGAQRSSAGAAAAVVFEQFAQRHTEGFFHQAGATQVARKLEGQGAA